ncbi:hypothetical protein BUALT_Bualt06G0039900 [Buddleja alternifolia]|uniref:Nudix hydrolase domain-containing protein n=1 Tax=Buddleja alternifolia TaxID=168488 RepID=A0AAV6XCR8_9LAMI|nr:hypothetical protein BUALT_Bualt06G0039900 [Buddleja alternifolia]
MFDLSQNSDEVSDSEKIVLVVFLLKFTGKEEEINLLGDGTEKAEFGEWSWLSPQQVVDLVSFFIGLTETELSPHQRLFTRQLRCGGSVRLALPFHDIGIFAASRLDIPDAWQMPQGGIDESEDPRNAAIRELREETGVTSADIVAEVPYWLTYDFPPEVREKLKQQWGSDWKGQAQKWFLLKFTGKEEEINLLGDGTEKAEFGEWSWLSPQQVVNLAVDFKKPVYQEVLKVFSPYLE